MSHLRTMPAADASGRGAAPHGAVLRYDYRVPAFANAGHSERDRRDRGGRTPQRLILLSHRSGSGSGGNPHPLAAVRFLFRGSVSRHDLAVIWELVFAA